MKSAWLLLACCSLTLAFAQKKDLKPDVSFHLESGYGFGFPTEVDYFSRGIALEQREAYQVAGGLQIGAAFGVTLHNDFRLLVHGHYQRSPFNEMGVEPYGITSTHRFETYAISTLIHYRFTDISESWYPYFSFGPSLYLSGREHSTINGGNFFDADPSTLYREMTTDYGVTIGGRATLGLERQLTERLCLTLGLQLRTTFLRPAFGEITLIEEDGKNTTSQYPNAMKQVEYVESINYNKPLRPSQPIPTRGYNLGYTGADVVLGLAYYLP